MRDYLALTKPRITTLIVICTAAGYYFGSAKSIDWPAFVHAMVGTALIAAGTAALNQWYEAGSDARMRRTRNRPIPAGRIKSVHGLLFGLGLSLIGFADLWMETNKVAALLGFFALVTYILLYTTLKQRSPVCTTIGAVPGAMPPLIGYAAATGRLDAEALMLFLILFIWQFPHFYAIAWMYREDYARGRIQMLAVVQPDGESTARRIVLCSVLLMFASCAPRFLGMVGPNYLIAAVGAGLVLLAFSIRFGKTRTFSRARHVVLASVFYLPVIFGAMVMAHHVMINERDLQHHSNANSRSERSGGARSSRHDQDDDHKDGHDHSHGFDWAEASRIAFVALAAVAVCRRL
jgi:protoheme IX farnesyltransferase